LPKVSSYSYSIVNGELVGHRRLCANWKFIG
jgi:hypothetical protein